MGYALDSVESIGKAQATIHLQNARAEARIAFSAPERIAAACADYRAGWTIDRLHDEADLAAGRQRECPLLLLWGLDEFPDAAEMRAAWAEIAPRIALAPLDCGQFVMEEAPDATAAALIGFLRGNEE